MADDRGQPVEFHVGECRCPGTPHTTDTVYLRPKPDLQMGLAARAAMRQSGDLVGDTESALFSVFIRYGVEAWNIVDTNGPVRVSPGVVAEQLGWRPEIEGLAVGCMALYFEAIFGPLVPKKAASPPPSPKTDSTSRSPRSGRSTPSSPSPSSPSAEAAGT